MLSKKVYIEKDTVEEGVIWYTSVFYSFDICIYRDNLWISKEKQDIAYNISNFVDYHCNYIGRLFLAICKKSLLDD